jgi:hypothetical protein
MELAKGCLVEETVWKNIVFELVVVTFHQSVSFDILNDCFLERLLGSEFKE